MSINQISNSHTNPGSGQAPGAQANAESISLIALYRQTRAMSEAICAPLEVEDHVVQPVPWVSPPKWHLAHTTWFFVNFCLHRFGVEYTWPHATYPALFNSYYKSESEHWEQGRRGDLSRPTVAQVMRFRREVDDAVVSWLQACGDELPDDIARIVRLGIEHEQQHQELLMMDLKYILWCNPDKPAYLSGPEGNPVGAAASNEYWHNEGGLLDFGVDEDHVSFCFDNETPPHQAYVAPFKIATRTVTNAEYLEFILDGGYQNPLLWLSEGWDFVQQSGINAPLYWHRTDTQWFDFGLQGLRELDPDQAVMHISFYEAWAFARWRGQRLPSEYEWQHFADHQPRAANELFLEACLDNTNASAGSPHGGRWEWTASPYSAYPGYQPPADALGEYNGKFMINQMVLRGGCLATPKSHYRTSYRNFYHANQRWLFSGLRLAGDDV